MKKAKAIENPVCYLEYVARIIRDSIDHQGAFTEKVPSLDQYVKHLEDSMKASQSRIQDIAIAKVGYEEVCARLNKSVDPDIIDAFNTDGRNETAYMNAIFENWEKASQVLEARQKE